MCCLYAHQPSFSGFTHSLYSTSSWIWISLQPTDRPAGCFINIYAAQATTIVQQAKLLLKVEKELPLKHTTMFFFCSSFCGKGNYQRRIYDYSACSFVVAPLVMRLETRCVVECCLFSHLLFLLLLCLERTRHGEENRLDIISNMLILMK